MLFLTIASVLHAFNIEAATGPDGSRLSLDVNQTTGIIS